MGGVLTLAGTNAAAVRLLANALFNAMVSSISAAQPWPFSPDSLDFTSAGNCQIVIDGLTGKVTTSFLSAPGILNPATPTLSGPLDLALLEAALVQHINAEATLVANAATTTITTQNTFYQLAGTWTHDLTPAGGCSVDATGRITVGATARYLLVATVSFSSASATNELTFAMFKNGTQVPDHVAKSWIDTSSYPNAVSISGIDDASAGDIYDLRVTCSTASGVVITPTDANFSLTVV